MDIEDILDGATGQIGLWLAGHSLTAARIVSWNRSDGLLVCRGGAGYTDDDVHYVRVAHIQGVTLRDPAPRSESDRLGTQVRDELRQTAGYSLSLAIHPEAFAHDAAALELWLRSILAAITALTPHREAMQAQIDQILLREGESIAVLGGSTLILEARPAAVPSVDEIRAAIAALL